MMRMRVRARVCIQQVLLCIPAFSKVGSSTRFTVLVDTMATRSAVRKLVPGKVSVPQCTATGSTELMHSACSPHSRALPLP